MVNCERLLRFKYGAMCGNDALRESLINLTFENLFIYVLLVMLKKKFMLQLGYIYGRTFPGNNDLNRNLC